ncbi:hypothetical protein NHQ30_003364 [Ciborinia camelliae]|nr:hypothetical protein NHQ30_003364 [Ciborinia camelliae]
MEQQKRSAAGPSNISRSRSRRPRLSHPPTYTPPPIALPPPPPPPPPPALIPRIRATTKAENTFANFVIPLAGLLTAVSTRLYDMGASTENLQKHGRPSVAERVLNMCASSSRRVDDEDSEEAPLLRKEANSSEDSYSTSNSWTIKSKKTKWRWFVQNTARVLGALLVTIMIVSACLFFAGMDIPVLSHSSFSPAMLLSASANLDEENFDKLKAGYDACMNETEIKNVGITPLQEITHQVTDMFSGDLGSLTDTIKFLAKLGASAFVSFGAGADDKDPDTVVTQVSPPYRAGLPSKEYYNNEKVVQDYTRTMAQVIPKFLPENRDSTKHSLKSNSRGLHHENIAVQDRVMDLARDVVALEKKLATASPDNEDRNDVTKYYNPMSLEEADKLTPQIHLSKIIHSLIPADVQVERLIMASPDYMHALSDILNTTPQETLQTYLIWKVIQTFYPKIEADELKPYRQFINKLQGKDPDSRPERWRTCVSHVDDGLGWILSRFFVEKAFSAEAKDFGNQIVSDIKDMFIEKLKATTWMDSSVIDLGIEKVHKIVQKIGYPTKSPDIMDPPSLHSYYQSVKVSESTYFNNSLNMRRFDIAREWSSLGRPVDRDEWGMTVPTVNAYYNPPGNEIVFPAGIMQFPVFDVNVPQYLSYGAFGAVSGHELSHAFDSTGRHYDQNGNYTDWWTPSTVAAFEERAECFIEQYGNYSIPGPNNKPLYVNGKLTLGENIADAGGLSASFAAWKKRQGESNDKNENLPGLSKHFTQDQLFFVSYANWWCGKSTKETAVNRLYTDPHAPKWARVLGTMANSREFKEAFSCKKKEPVCELW